MMDTRRGKSAKTMDAEDRISGLPEELRRHIVSFLPARDAVRTCVLSPKWRHIWESARRLDVDAKGFTSQNGFIKFVNALLLSRGCTPLESFWLRADPSGIFLENFHETASLWIHHALKRNVEELGIIDHYQNDTSESANDTDLQFFELQQCPFTSSYLKKLHLCYVYINDYAMKKIFSGCPALEDLEMINCEMFGIEFSSATLKTLNINYDHFQNYGGYGGCAKTVINMPGLVSLHIGEIIGDGFLSLVDVQSLVTASIYMDMGCLAFAHGCEILGALSNVKKLELLFSGGPEGEYSLSEGEFANLDSLTLSGWFLQDNCKTLLYLLEHSPNLEELILKISKHYESLDDD